MTTRKNLRNTAKYAMKFGAYQVHLLLSINWEESKWKSLDGALSGGKKDEPSPDIFKACPQYFWGFWFERQCRRIWRVTPISPPNIVMTNCQKEMTRMKKNDSYFSDDLGNNVCFVDDGLQPGEPGGYNSAGKWKKNVGNNTADSGTDDAGSNVQQ